MQTKSASVSASTIRSDEKKPIHLRMTPEQWIKIPDNPRQRDTERHLARAKHLLTESQTHSHVQMAICVNGDRYKLDGHTRALLWTKTPDLAPEEVYVTCFYVADREAAMELYTHFDAKESLETPQDKVSGAYNQINWFPSSSFLSRGAITNALRLTEGLVLGLTSSGGTNSTLRNMSVYELVENWKEELQKLDAIGPIKGRWNAALLTSALITIRRLGGEKSLEFWRLYNTDSGTKLDNEMDGVEALTRLIATMKAKRTSSTDTLYYVSRVISAFESWRRNKTYSIGSAPKQTNLVEYTKLIRKEQEQNND